MSQKLKGNIISGQAVVGRIRLYSVDSPVPLRIVVTDPEAEIKKFYEGARKADKRLEELYDDALARIGRSAAAIFEVHRMMLHDESYTTFVENLIRNEKVNAEFAVSKAGEHFSAMFSETNDPYMQARESDLKDITTRLIRILSGTKSSDKTDPDNAADLQEDEGYIIAAKELSPSEAVALDKKRILGIITTSGSPNSHMAILAKTYGIPAISGIEIKPEWDGIMAALDGGEGELIIEPSSEEIEAVFKKQEKRQKDLKRLADRLTGKETVTRSGRKIALYANIGSVEDAAFAASLDAEGIGLFRTEFLYLSAESFPREDEQFEAYRSALLKMEGKEVVIRTLDIGADKKAGYFRLEDEENPAMGLRGIRFCLEKEDILRTQLRALYRAGVYGRLSILFPMITSVAEVKRIKSIIKSVKEELREEKKEFSGKVKLGVMIETPAAAFISDLLAKEVDFFSIGTNDLTQYTLAVDRSNHSLADLYDPHHPAILRMIGMVVENAHKAGKTVAICGELGADMSLTKEFIKMGVDELSVSPPLILPLRHKIRSMP
ncbi:MAG: phosphoenolpyruvate--protein phosphotransferase [Lachnospiraceae bacterium]|nr:phosphoenolpyruvate--protein phosphotransferase [Lachnospiraceae bacterium]